ncbi:sodium:solute symporter family protein [Gordonia sp. CPCC 205515]|uniref:sodium:solute symporter family protein n=1 Tax=Gordonia sp. CPCC 205515 TaxID=3140791 RepID=UPI003AF3E5B1
MITVIVTVGIVLIAVLGMTGRKKARDVESWAVAERNMPRWTSWFLQAGESLTTFSFLGLAGIAFAGGASATFAVAYLTLSAILLYFISPRIRDLAVNKGYVTMSDFLSDRYRSPWLGRVTAVVGALSLIPYLQLQITGLGLIVQLATGSEAARGLSMVIASALVVLFVTRSGIRGIARVAYLKDVLMVVALLIVAGGVIISIGGVPEVFGQVAQHDPVMLTLGAHGYDTTFFVTSVIVTTLAAGFNTFPHLWPPVLAAKSSDVLRSNYKWLSLYQVALFLPIFIGFAAILVLDPATKPNAALFGVATATLPAWLVGVVAVAGASAAMVPSAAIAMGISTLVTRNVLSIGNPRTALRVNHAVVVVATLGALAFGLKQSNIAELLLITYGGLAQLIPAVAMALGVRVRIGALPIMLGAITGIVSVIVLTFADINVGSWDTGLVSLLPNVIVVAVAEVIRRTTMTTSTPEPTAAPKVTVEV